MISAVKPSRKPIWRWAAAVAVAFAIAYLSYLVFEARRPLSDTSNDIVMAMVHGDAGTLMRYAPQEERDQGGLKSERLQQVLDHLLTPYVRANIPKGKLDFTNDTTGAHAGSEYSGTSTATRFAVIGGEIYKTPDGLECNVLRMTLTNSWRLRFYHPGASKGELFRCALEGLAADRKFLEGVGLKGWVPVDPDMESRLMTWDEIEARDRRLLAEYDGKSATS